MSVTSVTSPFARLMAAYTLNELGLVMASVLIPLVILDTTGSAAQAGLVGALSLLASSLSGIIAGALADRANPGTLVRLSFALECAGWGLMSLSLAGGVANVWLLGAVAVLTAAVGAVDGPSELVILKRIAPTEKFPSATAAIEARASTVGLLGSPLAGVLFALGGAVAVGVQAFLHGIGALLVPGVRAAHHEEEDAATPSTLASDVRTGFSLVLRDRGLRHLMVVAAMANLGMVPLSLVVLAHLQHRQVVPGLIGLAMSCFGLGVLLGAPLAARLGQRITLGRLLQVALGVYLLSYLALIPAAGLVWATMGLVVVAGVMLPSLNTAIMSYTLAVTEERHVGKVFTAQGVPGMALAPLGVWLSGLSMDHAGYAATLGWLSAVMAGAFLFSLLSPALRAIPALKELKGKNEREHAQEG